MQSLRKSSLSWKFRAQGGRKAFRRVLERGKSLEALSARDKDANEGNLLDVYTRPSLSKKKMEEEEIEKTDKVEENASLVCI